MIPVKLTLSNFMPYRDNVPPLNFAGIHTASICGDNGSGKSSLIDAMTWALWGKTRARSDDDLIHQGETAMQVEFDFSVGEQPYRVIRKHARPKKRRTSGQSSLDLFVAHDGSFRPISGDKIADTQKKIVDILHMDYETFINSSFLRQGHADQFTVAKPAERKAVLTSIIGLSTYDSLEEQAKELASRKELEEMQLRNAVGDIDLELANQPAYECELAEASDRLSDADKLFYELDSRLRGLREQRESLRVREQQVGQLDEQIVRMGRDLGRWLGQAEQHQLRVTEYEAVIARRSAIEEGYARFVSARMRNDELNHKERLVTALRDREHRLDLAIEQSGKPLLREHAFAEGKIAELETKHLGLSTWRHHRQETQTELGRLDEQEEAIKRSRLECQNLAGDLLRLASDRKRTEREIVEINEKLSLLSEQVGAKCPLCESDLTPEHLGLIREKYTAEKTHMADGILSIRNEVAEKTAELDRLEKEMAAGEARLNRQRGTLQGKAGRLDREIAEAEEAGLLLSQERAKLSEIEERLAQKDYAPAEQEAKLQIEMQLSSVGYDDAQHCQIRQDLVDLEQYDAPKRNLDEADRLVGQERQAAVRAEEAVGELNASMDLAREKRERLAVELEVLPSVADALSRAETEFSDLREQQKRARETVGRVKEKLDRCAQMRISRQEKESQRMEAAKEREVYRELAEAFGKKGVQALLVETALPEIEAEANNLLARMTDNRMHVKFETQRETRKGDVLETLDINIADELGTRSYEMFSGGEAFRINFAIRIALSKLLARRAGAPLPTLIVDEGFGTQDATGMEKLKEAITSVQDDFEKILVITHIEDFRDAFPARIEVVKTAEGSTLELD